MIEPLADTSRVRPRSNPRAIAAVVLVLIVGAALRVHWNNVTLYSRADEQVYVNFTNWLTTNGWRQYPALCQGFVEHPEQWAYPNPMRWGYLGLTTLTCRLGGRCDQRALAWLSTVAGVLSLLLTFLLGRELFGDWVGVAAAGLACTSPLQLALGRRALQDEPYCAAALLFLWLLVLRVRRDFGRLAPAMVALAILAGTLAFAVKESSLLLVPALLAMVVVARWPCRPTLADLAVCLAPPLVFGLISMLVMGSASRLVQMGKVVLSYWPHVPYALQYQAGPPHRVLFDFFVLAPIVSLLAVAAVALIAHQGGEAEKGATLVAVGLVVMLLVFAILPSKNVRYVVIVDPFCRILAAWVLVRGHLVTPRWAAPAIAALIAFNAITEVAIFERVFVTGAVYDPVTEELLRALGAISH